MEGYTVGPPTVHHRIHCAECAFWDKSGPSNAVGMCCAHTPLLIPGNETERSEWPQTHAIDYCGEAAVLQEQDAQVTRSCSNCPHRQASEELRKKK